ncbi:imidazoleglycerol-phosphate dehydratase HisB [Desulfohalobiaceae bacterium Ax17]|jgi:imidazoleglycerol-phosphate dehydratase|uniref:imidazoleglycerol-phosphate dehydratase HisB n=1 Tax=Desulfovulcanus ferrireducens TaxID=2831190 RepID=UPI00207BB5F1|nr:imidazoleglycerol-phosphate dehydratase HisB [Desulfovulcanus ferrireducens]MBT8762408.1 imidazoleglycerol-phosphate dehydratase HisB [Desulfovulcanus ferrireducens]
MRKAKIERDTSETKISVQVNLDGEGQNRIVTGFGFADHMLDLMAFWAGFDLNIKCSGDLHIDAHHSLEDIAICLGQALAEAWGDRKGINRVGCAKVPMDEALAEVIVDISGRPYLVYLGDGLLPPIISGQEKDLWREFFKTLAFNARINMHIIFHYGQNGHHLVESAFKALGLALKEGLSLGRKQVLSTKGSLD